MPQHFTINTLLDPATKQRKNRPANDLSEIVNPVLETPCIGISSGTWNRPWGSHPILGCVKSYPPLYLGGPACHTVCEEPFGNSTQDELISKQFKKMETEINVKATWHIKEQGSTKAILSTKCRLMIPVLSDTGRKLYSVMNVVNVRFCIMIEAWLLQSILIMRTETQSSTHRKIAWLINWFGTILLVFEF